MPSVIILIAPRQSVVAAAIIKLLNKNISVRFTPVK